MSKPVATLYGILAFIVGLLFLFSQFPGCCVLFVVAALCFGLFAYLRRTRHTAIITQVEAEQEQVTTSQQIVLPPMTSKGSNRLFVPPTLK